MRRVGSGDYLKRRKSRGRAHVRTDATFESVLFIRDDEGVNEDEVHVALADVAAKMGAVPEAAARLPGGFVNHTYRLPRRHGGDLVVRFPADPREGDVYPVEFWASRAAARAGIPVAAPVVHGVHRAIPYLVSEFVPHDPQAIDAPWIWLGRYAKTVGKADLRGAPRSLFSRFGSDLRYAWLAHVQYNLESLREDDPLFRDGAYASPGEMRSRLAPLTTGVHTYGLAHGDLAPRNLIPRGPDRSPVLIDWGAAQVGPSPWTDARRVFEWAFVDRSITVDEFSQFAASAGVDRTEDRRILVSMTVLQLLDVARWALDKRPDLYDDAVQRCRVGLERLRSAPVV